MFLAEQPELNWRNAAVEEAQFRMVRGWLARGVDGFRLDVFNLFLKHPDLASNPIREGRRPVGPPGPSSRSRPARLPGADRAIPRDPRRAARTDVGRRAVRRECRDRGRPHVGLRPRVRLGADRGELDCGGHPCGDRGTRGRLRGGPLADRRPLESRSSAACVSAGEGDGGGGHGRGRTCRGGPAADGPRHAVPLLRRGAGNARRGYRARGERRSTRLPVQH